MENKKKETRWGIWNFDSIPTAIISSTLKSQSRGEFVYAASAGETYALLDLNDFFCSMESPPEISFHLSVESQITESLEQSNLILVGGPERNKITREVLGEFRKQKISLIWDINEQSEVFNIENPEKIYQYQKYDDYSIDYALITKHRNPFDHDKKVVILAGCRAIGTAAAARFLVNNRIMKAIEQQYGSESFSIVIKIDSRSSESPDDPLVTVVEPKQLKIDELPIILKSPLYEGPILDIRDMPDIPARRYILWNTLSIVVFISSLTFIFQQRFFFFPGLFASMAMFFSLSLRIWRRHKVVFGISPHFSLFGFWMSTVALVMSLVGATLQLVF